MEHSLHVWYSNNHVEEGINVAFCVEMNPISKKGNVQTNRRLDIVMVTCDKCYTKEK
jgi:hypothetical protein